MPINGVPKSVRRRRGATKEQDRKGKGQGTEEREISETLLICSENNIAGDLGDPVSALYDSTAKRPQAVHVFFCLLSFSILGKTGLDKLLFKVCLKLGF